MSTGLVVALVLFAVVLVFAVVAGVWWAVSGTPSRSRASKAAVGKTSPAKTSETKTSKPAGKKRPPPIPVRRRSRR